VKRNPVKRSAGTLAIVVATATLGTGAVRAADDTPSDVTLTKDLTAVIALQGLACGQVVSAKTLGENDYLAACQDGSRYRISVNADGRVVVEKAAAGK
jgi:hypothetical protein